MFRKEPENRDSFKWVINVLWYLVTRTTGTEKELYSKTMDWLHKEYGGTTLQQSIIANMTLSSVRLYWTTALEDSKHSKVVATVKQAAYTYAQVLSHIEKMADGTTVRDVQNGPPKPYDKTLDKERCW